MVLPVLSPRADPGLHHDAGAPGPAGPQAASDAAVVALKTLSTFSGAAGGCITPRGRGRPCGNGRDSRLKQVPTKHKSESAHRRFLEYRRVAGGQSARELVRATEQHAEEILKQLQSVDNGVTDARKIHDVAIASMTLLIGVALPLLRQLSGIEGSQDSKAETVAFAIEQQLDPKTPSPASTSRSSVASARDIRGTEGSPVSSSSPFSEPSRSSSDTNGKVLEWSGLSELGPVGSVAPGSKKRSRDSDQSRQNCVHAPFTMRFANSVFQGRGVHDFGRVNETRKYVREAARLGIETIHPVRLFLDSSEAAEAVISHPKNASLLQLDGVSGALVVWSESGGLANDLTRSGIADMMLDANEQPPQDARSSYGARERPLPVPCLKTCSCCPINTPFGRACNGGGHAGSASESATVSVSMDGCVIENDDWMDWGVAKYERYDPKCYLRYNSRSAHVQPSMDATPLWVFCHHEDLDDAVWILPESELQETDSEMQQPAGRDPGGEERRYGAHWLRQMDYLEQKLRTTFKKCEEDRLDEARKLGWLRRDIDWVQPSRPGQQSNHHDDVGSRMVVATVQVPRVGPRKPEASSSGLLSNSGVRYRRLRIAEARLLYLCAAIREHREGSLIHGTADELRLAAVRAVLDDLPLEFLRCLAKDPRVQGCAVMSAKRMRKKVLRELKEEAAAARKDPMTVLKATIEHSSRAGSIKAYRGMEHILNKSGFGHCLPSAEQMASAKKGIMRLAEHDLEIFETRDGYRISLRRAVEMEASRIMQTVATTDSGKVTVRSVGVQPGGHGWQDEFDIKITFDARRVTRHGSQTEVMLVFIPKGREGVDRCQKAVHHRTIAIWAGKDSKENVQQNLVEMLKEAKQLEDEGIVFSVGADSFLTVQESGEYATWLNRPEEERKRLKASLADESFHNVGIRFWVPADMLAQCSLLGQGCAGNLYCPHCSAHKETRHIPFELRLVEKSVNFRKFADSVDMKAETLWTINTCEPSQDRRSNWRFSEEGLRFMTAPSSLVVQVPSAPAAPKGSGGSSGCKNSGKVQGKAAAVQNGPAVPAHAPSTIGKATKKRQSKKNKATPKPAVSSAADCVSTSNRDSTGRVLGPDKLSDKLTSWRSHGSECNCSGCMIPANTVVRTMLTPGFSRKSEFLDEHWPQMTSARCPFCALHCLMRVTEALFQQICQFGMAGGEHHLRRLNEALASAGFKSKKFEKLRHFDSKNYEKLSFLGHESLHLLKQGANGERNIALILKSIWPQGDAPQRADEVNGDRFVARSIDLWEQWAKVVELMTERDPEELRKKNGFATFGKECRDFCFLFQAMFHKTQCKGFYLHTLMAHAGDFMRELEKHGMCLGMMSNSGAERRHEYGRRAFKRSLCGGCWAKHDEALALKRNLSAFLTLREVLTWQYGADLWTHEMATRAARNSGDAMETEGIESRRRMVQRALAELASKEDRPPLLSMEEQEKELQYGSDLAEAAQCLETGSEGWITVAHDSSKALEWVKFGGERKEGQPLNPWEMEAADGSLSVLVGRDPRLTNGMADWLSDRSGNGSEDGSDSDDGSEAGARFADLGDFEESDSDDIDYDPKSDPRLVRVLTVVQSDDFGVSRLGADDAELIQQTADGLWTACTAVGREGLPTTRSGGQYTSGGKLMESTESEREKRARREPVVHWGARQNDVLV